MPQVQVPDHELRTVVGGAIRKYCHDLSELELDAFLSGLSSTMGLKAVREGNTQERKELFYDKEGVRYHQYGPWLGRGELLRSLVACTGLEIQDCSFGLSALEDLIDTLLKKDAEGVVVEHLGTFTFCELQVLPRPWRIELER